MIIRTMGRAFGSVLRVGLAAGLATSLSLLPARGQDAAAAASAEEMRFVDGLNRLGLAAYAELVLSRQTEGPEVKVRRLQSGLARGEFDKVKAIIDAEPDQNTLGTWMMRRSLADAYFAWGKYPEARAIYDAFLAKFPAEVPAEFKEFHADAAYAYAQMLILMNDPKAAIGAYRAGLSANPPREVKRQFQGSLSDLLVREADKATGPERQKYCDEADQIAIELLWIQDLWFGRAIVVKAHVAMLKGDVTGAMTLVDDYRDQLVGIDESLKASSTEEEDFTRLSPMAEARYLLGSILLDEAKRAIAAGDKTKALELLAGKDEARTGQASRKLPGAVQHFINVFVNYPSTPWAADAGDKYEETSEILINQLGKKIQLDIKNEQWAKVEAEQAKAARSLLNQQKYQEAADQYLALLRRSPEGNMALAALADLGTCYIELGEDLYADTVIRYIAERFSRNPRTMARAGDLVLGFGNMYAERKRPERKDAIYEAFFANFTTHALAAQLLNAAGNRRLATNDFSGAAAYYLRVANDHSNAPVSYEALSRLALCYEKMGETSNQLRTLESFITRAQQTKRLNHELVRVMYRQATMFREQAPPQYPRAVRRYSEIESALSTNRTAYQSKPEEADQNQDLLELSMFHKASCFARATPPAGKPENAYKQMALTFYMKLVDSFPKSKLAPTALSQAGTLHTVLGNAQEAQAAFTRLKTQYPDAPESRNVDFMLGRTLLELGKRKEAVEVFKQMFSGGGKYSEGQILTAGNELFKAKEYAIAIEAYDRVLANAPKDDRALIEPALANRGRALIALGQYGDGAAALDQLFTQYPKSPYTVDCANALSRAYAELGSQEADPTTRIDLFNKAVVALKTVLKRDASTARRGDVTIQVGRIFELKAKAEADHGTPEKLAAFRKEAIANYQILTLFESPQDAEMRPYLEEAYYRMLAIQVALELWEDVFNDSGSYLQAFPDGPHALEIRQWRSRANAQLAASGGPRTQAAAPAPAAVPATAAPAADVQPAESPAAPAPAVEQGPDANAATSPNS